MSGSSLLGDLQGNVQRVVDHLGQIAYHREVSARLLRGGERSTLLPILHYALLDYSPHVAALVSARGFDLYGRDDASFTLAVFRLATLHLGLKPGLQAQQFLAMGFVGACARFWRVARAERLDFPPPLTRVLCSPTLATFLTTPFPTTHPFPSYRVHKSG